MSTVVAAARSPMKLLAGLDGQVLLLPLKMELKRPGQVPKEMSEASPGGFESVVG